MTTNILNFEINPNGHAIIRYVTADGDRAVFDLTEHAIVKVGESLAETYRTMCDAQKFASYPSVPLTGQALSGGLAGGVMTEQPSGLAAHQDYQGLTRQGVTVQSKIDKGDD